MIIFNYASKAELKSKVGSHLRYIDNSIFGPEYTSTGTMLGENRPEITGIGHKFSATVTLINNKIIRVS